MCVRACVCVRALLLQGADSREVCLNREGAQRPCSSCGVWSQMIGPLFFLIFPSVRLSRLFFDSFSPACLLLIAAFSPLHFFPLCFLFFFFCVFFCLCSVSAPGSPRRWTVSLLSERSGIGSSVCTLFCLQITWGWGEDGQDFYFWKGGGLFLRLSCLYVSVSDVVFSTWLHFPLYTPISFSSAA